MLKVVRFSVAIACISILNISYVQANVGETFENTCTIVKSNDKGEFHKKTKYVKPDFKLRMKDFYTNSHCVEDRLSLSRVASKDKINARF